MIRHSLYSISWSSSRTTKVTTTIENDPSFNMPITAIVVNYLDLLLATDENHLPRPSSS